MPLIICYYFKTTKGMAEIAYNRSTGRYHALFAKEDLGKYVNAAQAIDDLSGGYTFSHSSGVDTGDLGIPDDISEWTSVKSPPQ